VEETRFRFEMRAKLMSALEQLIAAIRPWSEEDATAIAQGLLDRLDEWIARYSARTVNAYAYDYAQWADWVSTGPHPESPISPQMLSAYLSFGRKRGLSAGTIQRKVFSLRTFLRDVNLMTEPRKHQLASVARQCNASPVLMQRTAQIPANLIECLDGVIDPASPRDVRDLAMLSLFVDTMAHISELLGLFQNGTWVVAPVRIEEFVKLNNGTGRVPLRSLDTRRQSPPSSAHVSARTVQRIENWLSISGLKSGPIFRAFRKGHSIRSDSAPYRHDGLPRTIRRLAKLAGITHRVTLACLRASTVNKMLAAGFHIEDVRKAGRWSRLDSIGRVYGATCKGGSSNDVLRRLELLQLQYPDPTMDS